MPDTSGLSLPLSDSNPTMDLDTMEEESFSLFEKGKLKEAETLHVELIDALSKSSNHSSMKRWFRLWRDDIPSPLKLLQYRLQFANVKFYLGRYDDTKNDLENIQKDIQAYKPKTSAHENMKIDLDFHCRHSLASYMSQTGRWNDAVKGLEQLLSQKGVTLDKLTSSGILGDLAQDYASLGQYQKGRDCITQARSSLNPEGDHSTFEDHVKKLQIDLDGVESCIDMLSGNYARALTLASKTLANLEASLGPTHFKTLSMANLETWCLVYEGRFAVNKSKEYHKSLADIESTCRSTSEECERSLGKRHPITLDSMVCLVHILVRQCRLIQAIETGKSVYEDITQVMNKLHPQAIGCKCQLAAAHFAQGNYRTSRSLYKEAHTEAAITFGPNHPQTVVNSLELARVCIYYGEAEAAFAMALKGAIQLVQFHYSDQSLQPKSTTQDLIRTLRKCMEHKNDSRLHPDLIFSLQVLAMAEESQDTSEQILRFAVEKMPKLEGRASVLETAVYRDLAAFIQENSIYEAIEIKERVVRHRKRLLGENHPDTLVAELELLMCSQLREVEEGLESRFDTQELMSTIENRRSSLLSRYGPQFCLTLYTQFLYLAFLLISGRNREAQEEVQSMFRLFSNPGLVSERLFESIMKKIDILRFLFELDKLGLAKELLGSTEQDIETALKHDANGNLHGELTRLGGVLEELKSSNSKSPTNEEGESSGKDVKEQQDATGHPGDKNEVWGVRRFLRKVRAGMRRL